MLPLLLSSKLPPKQPRLFSTVSRTKIKQKRKGGKYIQGTKRKGEEEGKGNIAAFTFESHEDSKRRRGGEGIE